ncbi:CatB-related O-acetyltransferase [Eubacterium limosum]|jgi:acetyltransferase-like isoleucine patch superfamily enzyme|nr:CatB-related O-acetyltransferase [Eubacterium limosum]PWW49665.1 acetyltransferase-like isoleucine patch superfamily enzyme [Eubacterium limosum]UQZ20734.1 CatB-related O-acetyltransferase [Eubacterium limosum]
MRKILSWGWRWGERLYLRKKQVAVGKGTLFNKSTVFEGYNNVHRNCHLYGAHIGIGSYMGDECVFNSTYIGKYCALGAGIRVSLGDHPLHKFVSIHPAFFSTKKQAGFTFCERDIWKSDKQLKGKYVCTIGSDVWIGDEVTILGGIKVADGSVVGAGAVVTRDTEPYGIYVGVPAKKIGSRFSEEDISFLLKSRWWDSKFEDLVFKSHLFSDIQQFTQKFEE